MARFIICKASAGSGKTYTLVRQFIEISISSPYELEHGFEHILAITFTNKAANGMKSRIMSQLHSIAYDKEEAQDESLLSDKAKRRLALIREISGHLGISEVETVRRCTVVHSAILHNYSKFSVSTIDSFVHRLVRTFAHDLRLPMGFNVMIEESDILQWTVDELVSAAGREGEDALTRILCSFMESRMDSGKTYNFERELKKLAAEIFTEEAPEYIEELHDVSFDEIIRVYGKLHEANALFETSLTKAAKVFITACDNEKLEGKDFPNKDKGVYPFFRRLADGDFSKINNPHARVDEAYAKQSLLAKNTKPDIAEKLNRVTPAYLEAYSKISSLLDAELSRYNTRQLLLANLYAMALLGRLNDIKNRYYAENEIVHISEFNKRIAEEVMNEPAPFIYERIGSRYHNYLIDEFQDTSRLQWNNFLPLLDEAMTFDFGAGIPEAGTQSLVVGDGKQAIYRFRGGDVRQFVKLPMVDSSLHGHMLKRESRITPLRVNHRTRHNIVEFNNRLFEHIVKRYFSDNDELENLYIGASGDGKAELIQELADDPEKRGGYVEVSFRERDSMEAGILAAVRHQVDDLGYSYGDILVLARDKDVLGRISDYFVANAGDRPVPVVSSESFLVRNSNAVRLLRCTLGYLYDTGDRLVAAEIVRLLVLLDRLPQQLHDLLWRLKESGYNLEKFLNGYGIAFNERRLVSMSLYDCCEELVRCFAIGGMDTVFVATFLDEANSYSQYGRGDIGGFIEHIDTKMEKLSSSVSASMDAVQLMTIHKAKGLESKIVIYALPNEKRHNEQMWIHVGDKELFELPVAYVGIQHTKSTEFSGLFEDEQKLNDMDRINVFYVAMTRAEEKLLVFCEDKIDAEANDNISLLHDFVTTDEKCRCENGLFKVGADNAKKKNDDSDSSDVPDTIEQDTKEQDTIEQISDMSYPRWEGRVTIASQSEGALSALEGDKRRYGIAVHELLSRITHIGDVARVVEDYCEEMGVSSDDAAGIRARIDSMLSKEENRRYFDPQYDVKNETSLVYNGEVLRPDRTVFGEGVTWVVDFKTGAFDVKRHEKYQVQVAKYAAALSGMGYPCVEPVIIYL